MNTLPRLLLRAIPAIALCASALLAKPGGTVSFSDGRTTVNVNVNNIPDMPRPNQRADDDDKYSGSQYGYAGPASSSVNCGGHYVQNAYGLGNHTIHPNHLYVVAQNLGQPSNNPPVGSPVHFVQDDGESHHVAIVVGHTFWGTPIIESKDNTETVRRGPIKLGVLDPTDPIQARNGTPYGYIMPPLTVTPPKGETLSANPPYPANPSNTGSGQQRGRSGGMNTDGAHDAGLAGLSSSSTSFRDIGGHLVPNTTSVPATPTTHSTHSMCFVSGTPVHTPRGLRRIEELKSGDRVYSYDARSGRIEAAKVTHTFSSQRSDLIRLMLPSGAVTCSQNHPFYTPEGRWLPANQFRPGEKIMVRDPASPGKLAAVPCSAAPLRLKSPISVYNLTVAGNSDYFVGPDAALCHNSKR